MRWVFVLLLALVVMAPGGEARAEKRVALVIGNAAYQNTAALNNPSNDAADLSAALQRLDFEVIEGRDLDKRAMERLVRQFGIKLAGADVALFFYAGHGLQVGGQNYLVPIDAKLASEGDVDFESLPVSLVARQMEREAKTSLILLDACRDNPLSRNLARAMSTRSSQVGQGLAEVKTGVGTLIAFSTQPGYVALDGVGRNSPYAEALLKYIEAPGQDVSGVLVEVRNDVLKATGGKQVPWEHTSLTGQVYLKAGPASGSAAAGELAKLPAARGPDPELEIAFWNSVKDSKSPAVIEAYLERYPNGTFAGLAKVMVAQLKGAPVKAPEQATRVALPEVKPPDPRVLARSLQTRTEAGRLRPGRDRRAVGRQGPGGAGPVRPPRQDVDAEPGADGGRAGSGDGPQGAGVSARVRQGHGRGGGQVCRHREQDEEEQVSLVLAQPRAVLLVVRGLFLVRRRDHRRGRHLDRHRRRPRPRRHRVLELSAPLHPDSPRSPLCRHSCTAGR